MTVGMIGLGKLGLPVVLGIESKGHKVLGFDISPAVAQYLKNKEIPFKEKDLQPLLDNTKLELASVERLVQECDIIFCAVQTPHDPEFEGSTRIPKERKDFDYSYLKEAIQTVSINAESQRKRTTLVVISTCLPGTYKREIEPYLNQYIHYVYNPFFIAMGTVLSDFFNPEFVLVGHSQKEYTGIQEFYSTIHDKECLVTDITTAEAIKVSYNTFITMKTVLGNTWGELAHKVGANVDDIHRAWSLATDRLISPKYLKAGVGDGGGCHPRDNIALSYIAKEVGLSHNIFEDLMASREKHMEWIADEAVKLSKEYNLPITILGRSFKPETNIETGSPAILLSNILQESGTPHLHAEDLVDFSQSVYVIGTQHERYATYPFPYGSIVLDPFRYIHKSEGVKVIQLGG